MEPKGSILAVLMDVCSKISLDNPYLSSATARR